MDWHVSITETQSFRNLVYYSGKRFEKDIARGLDEFFNLQAFQNLLELEIHLNQLNILSVPEILILEIDQEGKVFELVQRLKYNSLTCGLIIVLLAQKSDESNRKKAKELKVADYYEYPFDVEQLNERLQFLRKFKMVRSDVQGLKLSLAKPYKMPFSKRFFDIVFALTALVCLSPFLLIIALLIKLDSKGPVFYTSQRAGTGYKIFNFYKFRSMKINADRELELLRSKGLNQYTNGHKGSVPAAFVKLKQDPRITRFGEFLRNTSIDELPQLFNVLKGDMSIVGNRPLPLYEAKMLTSNEWCQRFLGPAGITGLWQVTKRGRSDMSDQERRELDNYYVQHASLFFDLRIIGSTLPALLQKEKV